MGQEHGYMELLKRAQKLEWNLNTRHVRRRRHDLGQ